MTLSPCRYSPSYTLKASFGNTTTTALRGVLAKIQIHFGEARNHYLIPSDQVDHHRSQTPLGSAIDDLRWPKKPSTSTLMTQLSRASDIMRVINQVEEHNENTRQIGGASLILFQGMNDTLPGGSLRNCPFTPNILPNPLFPESANTMMMICWRETKGYCQLKRWN